MHAARAALKLLLQPDDVGLQTHLAYRRAGCQHHGAECACALQCRYQQRAQHARGWVNPFTVCKILQLVRLTQVDDALAVKAGGRAGRVDDERGLGGGASGGRGCRDGQARFPIE